MSDINEIIEGQCIDQDHIWDSSVGGVRCCGNCGIPMEMPHELPKVKIGEKTYFQDNRLQQFRNVDNPHDFIDY